MNELEHYSVQTFENIKHNTEEGIEFWLAREHHCQKLQQEQEL